MKKLGQQIYDKSKPVQKGKNVFADEAKIYRLGIQAPPGTQFLLNYYGDFNDSDSYKDAIIEINQYGVYELDLKEGLGVINSLQFIKGAYGEDFFPANDEHTFYNKIYIDYIEEV